MRPRSPPFLFAAVLGWMACFAFGQTPGAVDPTFDVPVSGGPVMGVAVQPDGQMIIGGHFRNVAGVPRDYLARVRHDGTLDLEFQPRDVGASALPTVQPDGKIIVVTVAGTQRWNSDGTQDVGFDTSLGAQGTAFQPDGKIVITNGHDLWRLNTDGTFDAGFLPYYRQLIETVAVQPNGQIVIGGQGFWSPGGFTGVGRLAANGYLDTTFAGFVGATAHVVALQPDGKILVGTDYGLWRLNPDGSDDLGFNHPSVNGRIATIAVQANGKIIFGGSFTSVGGVARNYLARLNPDGSLDLSFDPAPDDLIEAVGLDAGGRVLVGGNFTMIAGVARSGFARLENDAATENLTVTVPSSVEWLRGGSSPEVSQLTFELSTDGGRTWRGLGNGMRISAGWELTGLNLPASGHVRARGRNIGGRHNASSGVVESVTSYALPAGPEIVVEHPAANELTDGAGNIDVGSPDVGFQNPPLWIIIRNTGADVLTLGAIHVDGPNAAEFSVAPPGRTTLAGGQSTTVAVTFTPTGTGLRNASLHIASNDTDESPFDIALIGTGTVSADSFHPPIGYEIHAMAMQPDEKIILAGSFGGAVARVNAAGTIEPFLAETPDAAVYAAAVQPDGKVVIGGGFFQVGSTPRNRLARFHPNGALDGDFDPNADGNIFSIAMQPDGKLLVAGSFSTVGGLTRHNLARLSAGGVVEPSFDPGPNSTVYTVAVQRNGAILVGGAFTALGDPSHNYLVRLTPSGAVESAFDPQVDGPVHTVALQANGQIVIGGEFTRVGGVIRRGIARLNADGALDPGFDPGANGDIHSIAVQTDGKMLVAGRFTCVGGVARTYIARLHADGAVDMHFNPNVNSFVSDVALQADGKAVICGSFSSVSGLVRNGIARVGNAAATQSLSVPDATRVEWQRGGASPETHDVRFEVSTDGGTAWTSIGSGTRIVGGWELTGLSLPSKGQLRARASTSGGRFNGSVGCVEAVQTFSGLFPDPEIAVERPEGTDLGHGTASVDFGSAPAGGSDAPVTFTIRNVGTADLVLGAITKGGTNPADFEATPPAIGTLSPGASTTFSVTFMPGAVGTRTAVLHIASNDADENPFDLIVAGTGTATSDADLAGLAISDSMLTPTFDRATVRYIANVGNDVISVSVTPTAALPNATITVNGATVASGTASAPIALSVGPNVIATVVTAPNGTTTRTYTITVTRSSPPGGIDFHFDPSANGTVNAIAEQPDGKLIIGGAFSHVGGEWRPAYTRLNPDGSLDRSFAPFSSSGTAFTSAVQADGKIITAVMYGPESGRYLRRSKPDGTADAEMVLGKTINSTTLQPDGKIIYAGSVLQNYQDRALLGRLNSDGSEDRFNANVNGLAVYSTAVQPDGKIVIGGDFWLPCRNHLRFSR